MFKFDNNKYAWSNFLGRNHNIQHKTLQNANDHMKCHKQTSKQFFPLRNRITAKERHNTNVKATPLVGTLQGVPTLPHH